VINFSLLLSKKCAILDMTLNEILEKSNANEQTLLPQTQSLQKKDKTKPHVELWPHQKQAVDAAVEHFKENERGTLVAACGTGKTTMSRVMWEKLNTSLTLVLVPSLDLLRQFKNSWQENTEVDFDALSVCSDVELNKDNLEEDQIAVTMDEIADKKDDKVTGKSPQILNFMRNKAGKKKVIFSTYQSLPEIQKA